jgi:hypothetical protein
MNIRNARLFNMFKNLKIVYLDTERKTLLRILKEFLYASFNSRSIATYYFTDFLYKKAITNYKDYISHKEWQYMQRVICDPMTYKILGDKLYFHEYYDNFKIPVPKLLAFSIRERLFVYKEDTWDSYEVTSVDILKNLLALLLDESKKKSIFIKPTVSSGGHGIHRFSKESKSEQEPHFSSFFKHFLSGAYIYQEEVTQHSALAKINSSSLNTIRIDTFKAFGQEPEVLSAYLRIGRQKGCVDNLTGGGMRVGIDMKKGTLKKLGTTTMLHGSHFISHHPDSAIEFDGLSVPFFKDVQLLAIKAASYLPQSLVGWDIAISESGPVLIEGNTVYYAMSGADIAYGGYRRNPVYKKVADYVTNTLEQNPRR